MIQNGLLTPRTNRVFGGIQNDHEGNQKAGFSITGSINRSDWRIVWNKPIATGGLLVGEEVTTSFEIGLIKADQFAQAMELDVQPSADICGS